MIETASGRLPWDDAAEGEVEVLFRPEDVTIAEDDNAHLTGRISVAFFLGDRTRLLVEGIADQPLVVDTPERREYRVGEPIGLRVPSVALMKLDT